MDNKEIEDLLNRIGADLNAAIVGAQRLYFECSAEFDDGATALNATLEACDDRVGELLAKVQAQAAKKPPQADPIKDAIALLEANGFIVGTKT